MTLSGVKVGMGMIKEINFYLKNNQTLYNKGYRLKLFWERARWMEARESNPCLLLFNVSAIVLTNALKPYPIWLHRVY